MDLHSIKNLKICKKLKIGNVQKCYKFTGLGKEYSIKKLKTNKEYVVQMSNSHGSTHVEHALGMKDILCLSVLDKCLGLH